ncbi:MAG: hypothetical protein AAB416_01715 [Patescibacteria group bacterium]
MKGGDERSCLVTLQGDSLGIPQVKEVQPDFFWGGKHYTQAELTALGT